MARRPMGALSAFLMIEIMEMMEVHLAFVCWNDTKKENILLI